MTTLPGPGPARPIGSGARCTVAGELFSDSVAATAAEGGWRRAVSTFLVDAIAERDVPTVEVIADGLRSSASVAEEPAARSVLLGMLEVAHVAGRQLQSEVTAARLEPASLAANFLVLVGRRPGVSNASLKEALGVDDSQISRAGRRLWDLGLAVKRRIGRQNAWELTPAGRVALERLEKEAPTAGSEPDPGGVVEPAVRPRVWNAPPRDGRFLPRRPVLDALETEDGPGLARQVINGFAGMGKTQVAVEYAHTYADRYDIVWWVRGQTLLGDIAALADVLDRPGKACPDLRAVAGDVRAWLETTDRRWLLVVDGVADPEMLEGVVPTRAKRASRVLATSRSMVWGPGWSTRRLDGLTPQEARAMATRLAGPDAEGWRSDDLQELVQRCDGHPLALHQAVAYMTERKVPIDVYLDRHAERRNDWAVSDGNGPRGSVPSVLELTTELCFQGLSEASATAVADLVRILAFLGTERIAKDDLARADARLVDGALLDDACERLRAYALATVGPGAVQVHPLVQQVLQGRMDRASSSPWIARAVQLAHDLVPEHPEERKAWRRAEALLPHVEAVVAHVDPTADADVAFLAGTVAQRMAGYAQARARFSTAKALSDRALALIQQAHGPMSLAVAECLRRHAAILGDLGDVVKAEFHLREAVRIAEEDFDVRERFMSAVALGAMLRDRGEYIEAIKLHNHAFDVLDGDSGNEVGYLERAWALASVAETEHALDRLDGAMQAFEGAIFLKEHRRLFRSHDLSETAADPTPEEDMELARTMIPYGLLLVDAGELGRAAQHLESAVEVLARHGGPSDPSVGRAQVALGWVHRQSGRLLEAKDLLGQGVSTLTAAYGPDHHEVGRALLKQGLLLWDLDELEAARDAFKRALQLNQAAFGPDHPDTARALNGLGVIDQDVGECQRAREPHARAVEIYQKVFPAGHTEIAGALDRLGYVLRELREPDEALARHEEALRLFEQALEEGRTGNRLVCVMPLLNMARALRDLDRLDEARDRASEAFALLSANDRDVGIVHLILGQIARDRGEYDEAMASLRKAREVFRQKFGPDHRDVAEAWKNIGITHQRRNELPEARSALLAALSILKKAKLPNERALDHLSHDIGVIEQHLNPETAPPPSMKDRVLIGVAG